MTPASVIRIPRSLFIDCTASAVEPKPVQPIFQGDKLVLQIVRMPLPTFSAALVAYVEAHHDDDAVKNQLCTTIAFPHAVEAYLGLVPCEDSSGGRRRLGAITKQGNPWARAALVQSAHVMLRTAPDDDPLKVWALAVQERRGKNVAVTALARRLAGVLWAMWRRRRSYDPRRLAARSAAGLEQASEETARQADEQTAIARAEHKIFRRTRALRAGKPPRSRGAASTEEVTGR